MTAVATCPAWCREHWTDDNDPGVIVHVGETVEHQVLGEMNVTLTTGPDGAEIGRDVLIRQGAATAPELRSAAAVLEHLANLLEAATSG